MSDNLQNNRMIQLGGEAFLINSQYRAVMRGSDKEAIQRAQAALAEEVLWLVTQVIKEILNREGIGDATALNACKLYAVNEQVKEASERMGGLNVN